MEEIIRYIIRYLLGDDSNDTASLVGYTADEREFSRYQLVIIPSGFFENDYGTETSLPQLPLQEFEGVPLLYGKPLIEGNILHADLIASAYFLMSRYEETVRRNCRDEHGRFPGKESLPYRANFIDRPILQEYGRLLRRYLNIPEEKPGLQQITLTHDVDAPFAYRTSRNMARGLKEGKNISELIRYKRGPVENDPYYTFPWILEQYRKLKDVTCIFFFKAGGEAEQDKPHYNLKGKDIGTIVRLIKDNRATIGLHASYEAGLNPVLITSEKARLEEAFGKKVAANRNHFLASREPEDMQMLIRASITDDYTMGYADVAGFRLGTARPVRWIDPVRKELTTLVLHPLLIMDATLSEKKYMGLNEINAFEYSSKLIRESADAGGELVLLWHNTSFADSEGYHRRLYDKIIKRLSA